MTPWVPRAIERWTAVGTGRTAVQQEHYLRLNWYWARALTGDAPAAVAAEAEELLAATLVDPPRWGVAYHHALIADMWLAAGLPDRAADALDRADHALDAYGQRYAEGLVRLLRARLLDARGEPARASRRRRRRPATAPPNAAPTCSPAAPRTSSRSYGYPVTAADQPAEPGGREEHDDAVDRARDGDLGAVQQRRAQRDRDGEGGVANADLEPGRQGRAVLDPGQARHAVADEQAEEVERQHRQPDRARSSRRDGPAPRTARPR